MRTPSRTPDRALLRDAAAIAAAMIAVGASFGAIAIAYGMPVWVPFLMSTAVFAGGAQFLAVGLLAAGNPIAAVFAGLLLNARHLPFGMAVSSTIGPRLRDRLLGSHLMTDEVVAFTLAETDPARRRRIYWLIGITLFTSWNTGTALGVWLGGATGDPATLGLDAAFPAGLLALLMPSLRDRDTRLVALVGAAVAVALTPVLPAGLPVLCALVGLVVLFRPHHKQKPTTPSPSPDADPASAQNRDLAPAPEGPKPNASSDSAVDQRAPESDQRGPAQNPAALSGSGDAQRGPASAPGASSGYEADQRSLASAQRPGASSSPTAGRSGSASGTSSGLDADQDGSASAQHPDTSSGSEAGRRGSPHKSDTSSGLEAGRRGSVSGREPGASSGFEADQRGSASAGRPGAAPSPEFDRLRPGSAQEPGTPIGPCSHERPENEEASC